MTAICALMLVARAGTGDTGTPPTGTGDTAAAHTGTTTEPPPPDTGGPGGSGDPGGSGGPVTSDTGASEAPIVLASDLAKETGGIGCVVTPTPATWITVVAVAAGLRRRKP